MLCKSGCGVDYLYARGPRETECQELDKYWYQCCQRNLAE